MFKSMFKQTALCLFIAIAMHFQSHAIGFPPTIAVQPLDQIVLKGGNATFIVAATSPTTLSYQWKFNGTNISGASGSISIAVATPLIYTRTNVQSTDVGTYSIELKNAANPSAPVTSSAATLKTVDVSLQFSSGQKLSNGFKLQLTGITATNYVIYASSNLVNWTPISTNSGLTGLVDFLDTAATTHASRFYRAQAQ